MSWELTILINVLFSGIASVAFAIMINVPHRTLWICGLSGIIGWMVYWFLYQAHFGMTLSNLLGTLFVGLFGNVFARVKKCPVTVFNIPGIVPLVPGVPAYEAIRAMVSGQLNTAIGLLLRVAIVTGAITIGFMFAQLGHELWLRFKKVYKKHLKPL